MSSGSDETDSESANERGQLDADVCAACGEPIETSEWHPIEIDVNADEKGQLYAFCSPACRTAWEQE